MNHSRLDQFESAIEECSPITQALFAIAVACALWGSVWWVGGVLRELLQ